MSKKYHHLTRDQRCQICTLLKRGDSQVSIARILKVHPSSISREINRNKVKQRGNAYSEYYYKEAHRKALRRRREVSSRPSKLNRETKEFIVNKLKLQWSPEQISGWMKRHNFFITLSHETIYKMIWKDKSKKGELYKNLRRYGRKYKKRSGTRSNHCSIQNRIDIDKRPDIVNLKKRIGDWEADTIIGKGHVGAVVTIVDRASKFTKMLSVGRKTAVNVEKAITSLLLPLKDKVLTITVDNGGEFANHNVIATNLETEVYFAKPYHSWERPINEHTNGLIRQYLPKNKGLGDITPKQIQEIENLLNNRPRKVLNYMTPLEVFETLRYNPSVALQN